ncbi:MAG: acyl-CoA thioesterase [Liquorilactobacillus ghanensis]|jgi:acyl-CoA hydrolase|uniref:Acyl-CoA hydrolase n=1 Tax=Liquorilactobacillus ghanensis DSM 18630 TaxID=1423750 RepID=A0A0R1VJI7_9LACO|nr:acyl-CoA thioesterase [Liquorilactobacillus ghanensis]KRM05738.1 acyl-CoA hydrolase [Liquorilactobacillus ghanensis DSM 18630]
MKCQETLAITEHRIINGDLNEHGTVYGGRLLELLDGTTSISAAHFAHQLTVTAAVDQFNFIAPLKLHDSFKITSYVSGAGKRSIEVFAKIIGNQDTFGKKFLAATAFLTFVTPQLVAFPTLIPVSQEEQTVCNAYQQRHQLRQQQLLANKELTASIVLN